MWYHKFEQMLEGAHKMEKMSRMQQRVYDYIAESIAEHGYAPSVREVGEALGLKSPSTVHFHIKHLQEMGLIEKSAGKGRAITLKKQLQAVPVAPQPVEIDELAPRRRQVPILGNVAAGNPILAQECIEDYLTFDTGGHDDEYFALRVRGESMLGVGQNAQAQGQRGLAHAREPRLPAHRRPRVHDLGPRRRRGAAVLSEKSNRSSANAEERFLLLLGKA